MCEDVVDGRMFSLNQLLDRKSGIDHDVNSVMLESGHEFGDGLRLIERFTTEDRYPILYFATSNNFIED